MSIFSSFWLVQSPEMLTLNKDLSLSLMKTKTLTLILKKILFSFIYLSDLPAFVILLSMAHQVPRVLIAGPLGPVQSGQVVSLNKWSFWVTFVTETGPDTTDMATKHTFHNRVKLHVLLKRFENIFRPP